MLQVWTPVRMGGNWLILLSQIKYKESNKKKQTGKSYPWVMIKKKVMELDWDVIKEAQGKDSIRQTVDGNNWNNKITF